MGVPMGAFLGGGSAPGSPVVWELHAAVHSMVSSSTLARRHATKLVAALAVLLSSWGLGAALACMRRAWSGALCSASALQRRGGDRVSPTASFLGFFAIGAPWVVRVIFAVFA